MAQYLQRVRRHLIAQRAMSTVRTSPADRHGLSCEEACPFTHAAQCRRSRQPFSTPSSTGLRCYHYVLTPEVASSCTCTACLSLQSIMILVIFRFAPSYQSRTVQVAARQGRHQVTDADRIGAALPSLWFSPREARPASYLRSLCGLKVRCSAILA